MRRCLWSTLALLVFAVPLHAQGLRWEVAELFQFGNCGEPLCLNVEEGNRHGDHYIAASIQQTDQLLGFLSSAIGSSVSSVPIGGSSGGSTFTFEGGLPVRSTVSAGPIFSERAQTIGRGRFLAGANATYYRFTTLRSAPMDQLRFTFTHENVGDLSLYGDPLFENEVLQVDMDLDVSVAISSVFLTYGLTDRLDLGIAVPLVHTSVSGESHAQIIPFSESTPHTFGGQIASDVNWSGSATGLGDIVVRGKANLGESDIGSIALLGDLRAPTGDQDNLLGAGSMSVRVLGILSGSVGDFSPHVNGGVAFRTGDFERNAILATVGFDHLVSPSATLAVDLLSSWEFGDQTLTLPAPQTFDVPYQRTVPLTNIPDRSDSSMYLSFGAKVATGDRLTIVGNTLTPIIRGGLQPNVAATIGLEYNP